MAELRLTGSHLTTKANGVYVPYEMDRSSTRLEYPCSHDGIQPEVTNTKKGVMPELLYVCDMEDTTMINGRQSQWLMPRN